MNEQTFEKIEWFFIAHKIKILRILSDMIEENENNASLTPDHKMLRIRDQSHATADMLLKIDKTLETLRANVKKCAVSFADPLDSEIVAKTIAGLNHIQ